MRPRIRDTIRSILQIKGALTERPYKKRRHALWRGCLMNDRKGVTMKNLTPLPPNKQPSVERMRVAFRLYLHWLDEENNSDWRSFGYKRGENPHMEQRYNLCTKCVSVAYNYLLNPPIYTCNPDAESGE